MIRLKSTKVYRGGVSASELRRESTISRARVDKGSKSLEFEFNIASKGGGTTQILLEIGQEDFKSILNEIASLLPQNVGLFSECALIANKCNMDLLKKTEGEQEKLVLRTQELLKDLNHVDEFIPGGYHFAPPGKDSAGEKIRTKMENVEEVLRDLR